MLQSHFKMLDRQHQVTITFEDGILNPHFEILTSLCLPTPNGPYPILIQSPHGGPTLNQTPIAHTALPTLRGCCESIQVVPAQTWVSSELVFASLAGCFSDPFREPGYYQPSREARLRALLQLQPHSPGPQLSGVAGLQAAPASGVPAVQWPLSLDKFHLRGPSLPGFLDQKLKKYTYKDVYFHLCETQRCITHISPTLTHKTSNRTLTQSISEPVYQKTHTKKNYECNGSKKKNFIIRHTSTNIGKITQRRN